MMLEHNEEARSASVVKTERMEALLEDECLLFNER
jgi:hypothetical protein